MEDNNMKESPLLKRIKECDIKIKKSDFGINEAHIIKKLIRKTKNEPNLMSNSVQRILEHSS